LLGDFEKLCVLAYIARPRYPYV